jgi:gliding motility-associated-like protein
MTTQLFASATSTTPIINYYWGPTDSLFNFSACGDPANCNNPFVTPYFTTTFTVAAMNADSCFAYDTITVEVQVQPSAFIPTAFTPNNDNLNDRFEFDILGVKKIDIAIFDRWGDKIYENQNQTNGITNADGWDGTVNGKPAPFDTYVYQMNLTYFDDVVKQITGTVTLLR